MIWWLVAVAFGVLLMWGATYLCCCYHIPMRGRLNRQREQDWTWRDKS